MKSKADTPSAKVLTLLEFIVRGDKAVSLSDAVEALGQPKPTVHRMLNMLDKAGWLVKEPDGKQYLPSPRLVRLGADIVLNSSVRGTRHAILQRLVNEIGETCNLTMLDGTEVVYLDRVEAEWPLRVHLEPGSRVPAHCSASGKLLISQYPPSRLRLILDSLPLKRFTHHTITDIRMLEAELDRTRAGEVGVDNEEYMAGLVCVAVPVVEQSGRYCAAVALQAPAARLPLARALEYVPSLRRAAGDLAKSLAPPYPAERSKGARAGTAAPFGAGLPRARRSTARA
jgi:IclR family transcriptional regulator, acetate operon repressor